MSRELLPALHPRNGVIQQGPKPGGQTAQKDKSYCCEGQLVHLASIGIRRRTCRSAHYEPFDVMFLGDRLQSVNNPADQAISDGLREHFIGTFGHHHVVQRRMSCARRIHAQN